MRRTVLTLLVVVLVAVPALVVRADGGLVPGKTLVEHWTGSRWVKATTPSPSGGDVLNGVDVFTATTAWAVGQHGKGTSSHPLVERWNGSKWAVVPGPTTPGGSTLAAVAAISASEASAVGSNGNGQPLIEMWNGTKWAVFNGPSVSGGALHAVDAASPTDAWAVGARNTNTLVEHWDGSGWSVVPSPNGTGSSTLNGVTIVDTNDAWAVGSSAQSGHAPKALIEHWDGAKWAIVKSTTLPGASLDAVAAISAKEVLAVGSWLNAKGCLRTLVLRWNKSAWKQMTTPNPFSCDNELFGIGASPSGAEAVGTHPKKVGSTYHAVTMAMALVNGAWKLQSTPNTTSKYNELHAAAMIPGTKQAFAVGVASNTFAP